MHKTKLTLKTIVSSNEKETGIGIQLHEFDFHNFL